jgi:hypothetical protein
VHKCGLAHIPKIVYDVAGGDRPVRDFRRLGRQEEESSAEEVEEEE